MMTSRSGRARDVRLQVPLMKDSPVADAAINLSAATPLHPFDILVRLDARIRARTPATAAGVQLSEMRGRLALRLGPWNLLFSMDDVAEIIPVPRITRVPGVKRWLLGIANLRGKVVSVSDLRDFLTGLSTVQLCAPAAGITVCWWTKSSACGILGRSSGCPPWMAWTRACDLMSPRGFRTTSRTGWSSIRARCWRIPGF